MIATSLLGLFMSAALIGSGFAYPLNSSETLALPPSDIPITTNSLDRVWTTAPLDTTTEDLIPESFASKEAPTTMTQGTTTVAPAKPIDWEAFFEKVKEEDAKLPSNEEMFRSIKKTLETVNPDFIPYRALHQTWGLKGMSPEDYEENIFLPYYRAQNPGQYITAENLPRGMKYRLVVLKEHFSEDQIMLMTPRDYARLCDQPENHDWSNCNYFIHICEKVCHYKIWYPDYQYQPEWLTKTIVFDEVREFLIHNYLRDQVPPKRSPTYVDPAYDQYVDDGMGGEDVQILYR